jgi:hypothetical protein
LGCYGISDSAATLTEATGGSGTGATLLGSNGNILASTRNVDGAHITATNANNVISAVGFTVPDGCDMISTTGGGGDGNQAYQVIVEHDQGNRAFGCDSEVSDVMYYVQNDTWLGQTNIDCTTPAISATAVEFETVPAGGGAPTANWAVLQ